MGAGVYYTPNLRGSGLIVYLFVVHWRVRLLLSTPPFDLSSFVPGTTQPLSLNTDQFFWMLLTPVVGRDFP